MALSDIRLDEGCCWYIQAYGSMSDYSTYTSIDFGQGKNNTAKMMAKWKANEYGGGLAYDLWYYVQSEVNTGWFVPSKAEWSAFAGEIGILSSNYWKMGLADAYWSSSQFSEFDAWVFNLHYGNMISEAVNDHGGDIHHAIPDYYFDVRLSTTF